MTTEVPAVSSAVRILETLARRWPDVVTPATLVNELKLNRSTCYNIVGTLEQAGWVSGRNGRPGWTLGPRLLMLTGVTDKIKNVAAQQEIEELNQQLGFVVFVAEQERGGGYRVVAVAERSSGVRVTVSLGDTFPFAAPALMQSFLAWSNPGDVERLVKEHGLTPFTKYSITELEPLNKSLAEVRKRGYAESLQQFNLAQGGVAAPVFEASGKVSWVVCSLAFSTQLDSSNVAQVGEAIRRCAENITARTGGVVPADYRASESPPVPLSHDGDERDR